MHAEDYVVEQDHRIVEALFELDSEEDPSVVRKFNKKLGL
jgi:hypothetical protein